MSVKVADHLQPGDTVVVGQAAAEPPILVGQLIDAARSVDGVTALCGYCVTDAWKGATPGRPRVMATVAAGPMRKLAPGVLDYLPLHASRVQDHITSGALAADVVLLQVGPVDADGYYALGGTVDHCVVAAERARAVLVEVNMNMPRTRTSRRLHRSLVTAELHSSAPLAGSPARPPNDVERAVAANIATLVPDGGVIQLGLGSLADAVGDALRDRRGLRVRSGLVGDWLVGLDEAGALAAGPDAVVANMALGGPALYAFLDGADSVELATNAEVIGELTTRPPGPLVAVNAAMQVDLLGQVAAEVAGERLVGGVGGQVDFLRAAHRSPAGAAVIGLPGDRIVARIAGPVTSLKSDVDVVVTEWGVADIRACSVSQRVEQLIAVAHPDHRAALRAAVPSWI